MRVAVVGGKLQGIEAVYLGLQANWEVLLIDRIPNVPARGLAHSFIQLDVTKDTTDLSEIFKDMDLIIPALENEYALESLRDLAKRGQFPLAFDEEAYAVTRRSSGTCLGHQQEVAALPVDKSAEGLSAVDYVVPFFASGTGGYGNEVGAGFRLAERLADPGYVASRKASEILVLLILGTTAEDVLADREAGAIRKDPERRTGVCHFLG